MLAPGVELVRLDADRYTLRSEFDAFELSGEAVTDFVEFVLTDLQQPLAINEIHSRLPLYSPESVIQQIDLLIASGVLIEIGESGGWRGGSLSAFLRAVNLDEKVTVDRLRAQRVGIFGLEAHGSHLALMLARLGVGTIRLVDPFACEPKHMEIGAFRDPKLVGQSLQSATAAVLAPMETLVELGSDSSELDEAKVRALVEGCDLVFGCWDQAFGAATHWLNQAALATGVPALFSELHATKTFAGPLYLPNRSACWMCYRMRSIACAPDFEQAMAYEEHLDQARRPRLASRPILPFLPEMLGSALALEAMRLTLGLYPPVLVDTVAEFDAFAGTTEFHPVLAAPSCPICSKKNSHVQPTFEELVQQAPAKHELVDLRPRLVDRRTGIITQFSAVPRDTSEVAVPLVWRAKVANHRYFPKHDEERATCSGKGMDVHRASTSCLGEAIERYSAACWDESDLMIASRDAIEGRSIDPRELVLFLEEQYALLPYAPYRDEAELAWMRGRSLTGGDEIWIPAMAVVMDYPARSEDEYLFGITSNGLAAGSTLCDAVLGGLTEVLERDAMLIAWYNGLAGRPHDASTHPDADVRRLAQLYTRRGVELALIELPTDHPVHVFMGIALQTDSTKGPATVVGLGADLDPLIAARKAAMEVGQVRPSIRRRMRFARERMDELADNPSTVESMEDHALLYAHQSTAESLGFLFGETRTWTQDAGRDARQSLSELVAHFRERAQEVAYVDLTPPDMRSLGVYTVRVVAPGFQPISFGQGERRLGGRRLFDFPVAAKLRSVALRPPQLNPMPHPIA